MSRFTFALLDDVVMSVHADRGRGCGVASPYLWGRSPLYNARV